jgi:surfeit locus 1 family protein
VVFATLVSLGVWQIQRLSWKLDLIAQIEARAYGEPVPAPIGPAPEYLHVTASGTYTHDQSLRIKAVTALGAGYWIMTPLQTAQQTIWVNRGFVPTGTPSVDWTAPSGPQVVSGLARLPKSNGTFLEKNDPAQDKWFSADLAAMSERHDVKANLQYYIDAEQAGPAEEWPRAGMTQLHYRNSHLSYALTWFAMAALLLVGLFVVLRHHDD